MTIGAAAWRWRHPPDPFARLGELESEHESAVERSEDRWRELQEQQRTDPYNLTSLVHRIHYALEYEPARAAEECQRVLLVSPRNYFALHHAAMAFLAMTNLDRALYYAAGALQVEDTSEAHFVAGHIFYAKRDFPNALKHYGAVLAKTPGNREARDFVEKARNAMATTNSISNPTKTIKL